MDYEDWRFPFGKYKGRLIAEIPDTYLDWLLGADWFFKKSVNKKWTEAIIEELKTRKRSGYHVEDDYGKTLEAV